MFWKKRGPVESEGSQPAMLISGRRQGPLGGRCFVREVVLARFRVSYYGLEAGMVCQVNDEDVAG